MNLSDLYAKLDAKGKADLAKKAGTSLAYLYQLANRIDDRRPSVKFMARLAAADRRLTLKDMAAEFAPSAKESEDA